MKISPELVPMVAKDSGTDMSDRFSMFRYPTHACLLEAHAHDLLDGTFSRATANLKSLLNISWIIHPLLLVFKVSNGLGDKFLATWGAEVS